MDLFLKVLEIVTPVFALALIGYVWVKLGIEYRVQFVTRMVMGLAAPCLIFTSLMQTEIAPEAIRALSLASIAAYAAVTLVMFALVRVLRLDRRTYWAPLIGGNTGNLGLPLALFAFGDVGLEYAVVVFGVMALYSFTFGVWIVAGGGGIGRLFGEPIFWATLLGGLFLWQGWQTPEVVTRTMELLGQMMIPIMLITLGVALARLKPERVGRAVVLSALKYVICAGLAWGIGRGSGLEPVALAVLTVQVATPVAVTSYMLAEKYDADAQSVAGLVVVSTLMSVVALPILLGFFVV